MDAPPQRAVFLSYAREDASVARSIAEALRNAGIEVWFDENELRGGDAWDHKIRRQIKDCALFLPLISAHTQNRGEGYFRLEWKLADQRTDLLGRSRPFLLPIGIDDTPESEADVPDSFVAVQWIRLSREGDPAAVAVRTKALLSTGPVRRERGAAPRTTGWRRWAAMLLAAGAAAGLVTLGVWKYAAGNERRAAVRPDFPRDPNLARAWQLIHDLNSSAEDFELAEDIVKVAAAKDPTHAEAAIVYAWHGVRVSSKSYDRTDERYIMTARYAERAMQLAPENPWAVAALAGYLTLRKADGQRAEELIRRAIRQMPLEPRFHQMLVMILLNRDGGAALAAAEAAVARMPNDAITHHALYQCYRSLDRAEDAQRALDRAIELAPVANLIIEKVQDCFVRGDVRAMRSWLDRIPPASRLSGRVVFWAYVYAYISMQPDFGLRALHAFPGAWIRDGFYTGTKALLIGDLLQLQGQREQARIQFEASLNSIRQEQTQDAASLALRANEVWTLCGLGRLEDARAAADLLSTGSLQYDQWALWFSEFRARLVLGQRDAALQFMRRTATNNASRSAFRSIIWVDPRMEQFRNDPEIAEILAEVVETPPLHSDHAQRQPAP